MNVGQTVRGARQRAHLTQLELAERAGTSQATVSAYEAGTKVPSVATLTRLLDRCGLQLAAAPARRSRSDLETSGQHLHDVLVLAEALPFRRSERLRYPRLPT